jgi:hypothetical protein
VARGEVRQGKLPLGKIPRVLGRVALVTSLALASLGLSAITAEAAPNDVLIFTPTADAYVYEFEHDENFGDSTNLLVDAGPTPRAKQSFLRFDVQGRSGRKLLDVRLRMFQSKPSGGSPSGGRVYTPITDPWQESTVTWDTRPSFEGASLRGSFGDVQSGHTYTISLGTSWLSGDGLVNLGMKSPSTTLSQWGSREHRNPPQLILVLAPRSYPTSVDKFTFNPVADAYVDEAAPDSNFGQWPSLWVENEPISHETKQSFIRFSVTGLSTPEVRTVTDVRLRLFQVDASPQGGRVFKLDDNSWDEMSVTWDTRPIFDPADELNSFGRVTAGHWYEVDLGKVISGDGDLNLAIDSVNSDRAKWASRESANAPKLIVSVKRIPGFVLDGLSTVAGPIEGSSEPTFFASQHHMVKTAGGRLLVVYGRHASGLQLAWRDKGGGWQTDTTGAVTTGQLFSGRGTGDWPASIVVANDSKGRQHAWVLWARPTFTFTSGIVMRRLSNLDSSRGPKVGRKVAVEKAGLGTALVDMSIERSGTRRRAVIVWTRKTGASSWAIQTKWFTNLDTDAPTFVRRKTLLKGTGTSRGGSLIPSAYGMRLAVRDNSPNPDPMPSGKLRFFGHNLGKPLDSWWSGTPGVALPTRDARVAGVARSDGSLAATAEIDTVNHVVTVQTFTKAGKSPKTILDPLAGYAQPVLATDGANLYLVMIKCGSDPLCKSDSSVVSWKYDGVNWTDLPDFGISGTDCDGNCSWPNVVRRTDGRLRFVVRGPNGGEKENAVLAFQRPLS